METTNEHPVFGLVSKDRWNDVLQSVTPEALAARDRAGKTLLHHAAASADRDVIGGLVDRGAQVEAQDDYGERPLHSAAIAGNSIAVETLVAKGANVRAASSLQRTALHYASRNDDIRSVRTLLDAGADPLHKDVDGFTPLQYHVAPMTADAHRARSGEVRAALEAAPRSGFTRRDIHSALLTADATLAKGSREEIPVLRLLDAERDAARRELAGKVTRAEAELHAELVAHRLMDQVKENPISAATVGEQLRAHGALNLQRNSPAKEDRSAETVALVSAYKATQFTEKGVADRLATQAVESLKTMASMGQTIDQTAKPEPDRLQAILGNARSHVATMIEQQSQRARTEELAR